MGQKGNLAVFESSSISEIEETTPIKIGVHACYINPYSHEFSEPILFDSIFLKPMDYKSIALKGNFGQI